MLHPGVQKQKEELHKAYQRTRSAQYAGESVLYLDGSYFIESGIRLTCPYLSSQAPETQKNMERGDYDIKY